MPTSILPTHTCSFELNYYKVFRGVGTDLAADTHVAPVNNGLHSLFSQVDVYLNDTFVTPSSNT